MATAQMRDTLFFPLKRRKANVYRNAEVSGEITIGFSPTEQFAKSELLNPTFSADLVERENLLVDMLINAGIISPSDAAQALVTSPEVPVVDYLKSFCYKSDELCRGFSTLSEKVWCGKLTLNQAAVAANHLYTANATVAEAVRLVKWAGQ